MSYSFAKTMSSSHECSIEGVIEHWDTSPLSIDYNNISENVVKEGLAIYESTYSDTWKGIYSPEVYGAKTLWNTIHSQAKIRGVIDCWRDEIPLSPLYLIKRGYEGDLALVSDGKHRLTVASAIKAKRVPFMVALEHSEWVEEVFPNAKLLGKVKP